MIKRRPQNIGFKWLIQHKKVDFFLKKNIECYSILCHLIKMVNHSQMCFELRAFTTTKITFSEYKYNI